VHQLVKKTDNDKILLMIIKQYIKILK